MKSSAVVLFGVMCVFWSEARVLAPPVVESGTADTSDTFYLMQNKVIYLNHGKLEYHEETEDDLKYHYRWLEDDIVNSEDKPQAALTEPEVTEKTVSLPGGCQLSEAQFAQLETFKKKTNYVKKCYCEQGGVYCQLKKPVSH